MAYCTVSINSVNYVVVHMITFPRCQKKKHRIATKTVIRMTILTEEHMVDYNMPFSLLTLAFAI